MPKKKEERWQDSKAKQVLKEDIMSKMVLPTTKPKIVYSMRVEYKKWPYTNFVPFSSLFVLLLYTRSRINIRVMYLLFIREW